MAEIAKSGAPDLSKLSRRDRELIKSNPSLRAMFSPKIAPPSVAIYSWEVMKFCKWLGVPDPQKAVVSYFDWSAMASDYILQIEKTKRIRARRIVVSSLNAWFKANKVYLFQKINPPLGKLPPRTPALLSKKDLSEIVLFSDLSQKIVILTGATSGLSASQISELRLKDVELEKEIPLIHSRNSRSFTTPENKKLIRAFLRLREKRKETLSPDSYLTGPKFRNFKLLDIAFQDSLKRAGLTGYSFSSLRDYFRSWSKVCGVDASMIDYFTGAKKGIRIHGGTSGEKLLEEYRRLLPAVSFFTIDTQAESLKERILNLKTKVDVLQNEAKEARARLDEQRRINRALVRNQDRKD